MTASFSDRLLALARPNLAWVSEQLDLFDHLVPQGVTHYDLGVPSLWRSGVTLNGQLLGTYALDGTWLWAWGNSFADSPGAALAHRLRELGAREEVPELTDRLLDFTSFANPRLAADHLLLICMGLLDARGAAIAVINERGRAFLVTDDPSVPRAEPRPARLVRALRTGPAMLPGDPAPVVRGWFARHGIEPVEGEGGRLTGALPGGAEVLVVPGDEEVAEVLVSGGEDPLPEQELIEPRLDPDRADQLFPPPLLPVAARSLAYSLRATRAMVGHAAEHLDFQGRMPEWDAAAGGIRFPGGVLAARPLGGYDLDGGWFRWAPGTEDIRAAFRAAAGLPDGAVVPELDEDRVELARYLAPEPLAVALARTAATAAGYVFTSLGSVFYAVTDDRLPAPATDPASAAEEVKAGASWLHPLTPAAERPATMRAVAESYFTRLGVPLNHYGLPDFISGSLGLHEVRVYFAPDGTITRTTEGLFMTPQ